MKKERTENLVGKNFDFITVIARAPSRGEKSVRAYWLCKCDCGVEKEVRGESLKAGTIKSCGCRKTSNHRLKRVFDSKYEVKQNGCWEWTGYKDKDGYPKIGDKCTGAHRYSYKRFKGEIPVGMLVCHSCDNPSCVNPGHLWLGTQKDNMNDKVNKNRQHKGSDCWNNKTKSEWIPEIISLWLSGISQKKIGEKFGLSQATVWRILEGKTCSRLENYKFLRRKKIP